MNDKKLKDLFDYQKFEKNSALDFAIQSAHAFINQQSKIQEMSEDELDMLNAAGVQYPVDHKPVK